ncbi:MAG: DUF3859 domain-containing protein [Gammaproteobacteria bacterium]
MNKFTVKCIAVFLLIVCGGGVAHAAGLIKAEVTEYGYYKKKGDFKRYRNIATTTGYVKEGSDVELVKQTHRVPLAMNRLFGFKFRVTGFDDKEAVQLKLVVTHPKIKRANGSTSTGYSYPVLVDVKDGVIENRSGYSIDHDYEMVEGTWTFELWYYKQKLVSQTFETVAAEEVAATPDGTPQNEQQSEPRGESSPAPADNGQH